MMGCQSCCEVRQAGAGVVVFHWTIVVEVPADTSGPLSAMLLRYACSSIPGCAAPRASNQLGLVGFEIDVPDQQRSALFANIDRINKQGAPVIIRREIPVGWR